MKSPIPPQTLERLRIMLSVDEPTVFAQTDDEIRYGIIERVLMMFNEAGDPYQVAFARLERPLAYGGHSSAVVSLMTRYAKSQLADLLSSEMVIVNIGLEELWVLEGDSTGPRIKDRSKSFYLGYGTVSLANAYS